jgi:cbb3-type cytochrome oxidase subunit 3
MNPLLEEAASSVEAGWVLGLMTVVFLAAFLWWVWYAYTPRNQALMEEASRMPLGDGGER